MQVSVEATEGLERRVTVQVPAARVDNEVENRLLSLGKRAKIKGFRPGKVPLKVVKSHYGAQVREEVLNEVLRSSWQDAISQENLTPAGGPRIDTVNMEPGADLEYTATFEAYPEIELGTLEGLKVERPNAEVTEADLDAMVENLREQRVTWESVERASERGDRLRVDFEGDIDGAPFAGNKAEDSEIVLGESNMVAGFEDQLIGARAGETRDIEVRFPDDYGSAEVAGKNAHFKVTVHAVEARRLPELDAEFCESFGIESGDVDEFRADVKENMERERDDAVRRNLKKQVLDILVADNPVELPNALVADEIQKMREETRQRIGAASVHDAPELPNEIFAEQARRRVTLGLIIGEIIKREELEPEPARVQATIDSLTEDHPNPAEMARAYRSNADAMRQIEAMALEEQAVDRLLDKAEISEQQTTFKDLLNFNAPPGVENAESEES